MTVLALPLLLPFLTALGCVALSRRPVAASRVGLVGALAQLAAAALIFREVLGGSILVMHVGGWPAPFGIALVADVLSALMLLVTAVIAVAIMLYAPDDVTPELVARQFYALVHFLLMGVNGAFLAGDLFNLYVWFEVMLLTSFVLIVFEGRPQQLEGGVKYVVINIVSSLLFLCGVGLIYAKVGALNMAEIARVLDTLPEAFLVRSSAMLLLASFAIKSALFPFFFWLPASYHTPRTSISALFAGLLTKVGIYALFRANLLIFHHQFALVQDILLLLAGLTMVTGVLGAAVQYDMRKILSFHIISQIGYILMGLAVGTRAAIAGAIFYTIHHILVKSNLFLICGLMARAGGSSGLRDIGGLLRRFPLLAAVFVVPSFSLCGIPPLSGFWAKLSVVQAALQEAHYWLATAALLVGVLTLYSMIKIWAEAFWAPPPANARPGEALRTRQWIPCIGLALLTILIGLYGQPLFSAAELAADQLLNPDNYINAVLGGTSP